MKMLRVATVASVAIVLIGFASQAHAAPPLQTGPLVSYADAFLVSHRLISAIAPDTSIRMAE
jgi:hypothetical protein